jgi:hypothetical protein
MVGNSVATLVVAKWEGVFDRRQARAVLNGDVAVDALSVLDDTVRAPQPEPAAA